MDRKKRIQNLAKDYISIVTHTGTKEEKNAQAFFEKYFQEVKYFTENVNHRGFYPLKNDPLKRKLAWALVKGKGHKTIVLIHHSDTVDTDDFGPYKDQAYNTDTARKVLEEGKLSLNKEAKEDLAQGGWLFGRGLSDMKGGGSIELALLEEYSQEEDFQGNVLLLALPDEENSSAGMRSASYLMKELKDKYHLDYQLMIDAEPHEREKKDTIVFYDGSIGKLMPLFLARGKLAHSGQIYTGLNPIHLLAGLVRKTELCPEFVEKKGNSTSPGPAWFYFKDRKQVYDVSLPLNCAAYMSILPLSKTPKQILERLKEFSEEVFEEVIEDMKKRYKVYRDQASIDYGPMEFQSKVYTLAELLKKVKEENPGGEKEREEKEKSLILSIENGEIDRIEASIQWMEHLLSQLKDKDPCIVVALAAPYYPAVNNRDLAQGKSLEDLWEKVQAQCKDKFSLDLEMQNYFTGICDLSYGMFTQGEENIQYIEENMIFWGKEYHIPLDLIKEMSMPVVNIGPWGKDLHKYTERVWEKDLLETIPYLMDFTIRTYLKGQ